MFKVYIAVPIIPVHSIFCITLEEKLAFKMLAFAGQ